MHSDASSGPILSIFKDDPEMRELVDLFVEELPDRVALIEQAASEQSWSELGRLSHQLKGAAPGYGFDTIGEAAHEVEAAVMHGPDIARAIEATNELIDLCRRARAA